MQKTQATDIFLYKQKNDFPLPTGESRLLFGVYDCSSMSKKRSLLHKHCLKPVSTLPSIPLRPRKVNFSPHSLQRIVTFVR